MAAKAAKVTSEKSPRGNHQSANSVSAIYHLSNPAVNLWPAGAQGEPKLRESLIAKSYNIDLRTGAGELDKLLKEEIEKYSRFSADELGWKAQ